MEENMRRMVVRMVGAERTAVVVTDEDGVGGGGENVVAGREEEVNKKRRKRKAWKTRIKKWSYQTTPLVHTKIIVLLMVLYLCPNCVSIYHFSFKKQVLF